MRARSEAYPIAACSVSGGPRKKERLARFIRTQKKIEYLRRVARWFAIKQKITNLGKFLRAFEW
jgi:hypothetical protein